jgi:hypothetical protein
MMHTSRAAGIQVISIVMASMFAWLASLLLYLNTGTTDPVTVASIHVAGVSVALAYFRVFRISILCVMLITQVLSWNLLPEYSMSFADKMQAIGNLNRIGFGGVSVMAFASMLSGVGAAIWPVLRRPTA